jgi:hypothetical protein
MKQIVILLSIIIFSVMGYSQQLTSPMDFLVNSPMNISGEYYYGYPLDFGPTTLSTVTGGLEWAYTSGGDSLACTTVTTNLSGKVALVRRGICNFTTKIYEAQLQGAIGCVILNNTGTNEFSNMTSGTNGGLINIPSVFLSYDDGQALIAEMELGNTVNVSFYITTVNQPVVSWAYKTPIDQIIEHSNMRTLLYNNTGVAQSNVTATLDVTDPLGALTNFSALMPSIAADANDEVIFPGTFTPTALGTYYGTFKSSLNPNDSVVVPFEITQNTYSLDNDDLSNAKGVGTGDVNFQVNNFESHQGSLYSTGSNGFLGDSITATFALENANAYLGEMFVFLLYKTPSGGFLPNTNDYSTFSAVALAIHTVTVADTLVPHTLITEKLIDANTFLNIESLDANEQYMLVIKYEGSGTVSESPKISYTHNERFIGFSHTVYSSQLYLGGFVGNPAPVIRLNLFSSSSVGIEELSNTPKQLLKIVDLMGRETKFTPNTPLIYIYSDGTTERVFKLED